MPNDLQATFKHVSSIVQLVYEKQPATSGLPDPGELIEAINQFFVIYERLGNIPEQNPSLNKDSISQIGDQTIRCLTELANWADKLDLPQEKAILEEVLLAVVHWVIRHRGELLELEAIVNILADKANQTSEPKILSALYHVLNDVIDNTSAELKNDVDKSDPSRPWRMLNFNFAIIATRTMNTDLMTQAFDKLGRNLPEDCPQFFEEGLRQSEKPVYGPEIKTMMAEYFKKWTTLH